MEDAARSVSPAALYEKLEQVYRLLCGKVGSRSLGSGQGRYLQLLLSRDGVTDSGREAAAAFRQESAGALQDAFDVLPADAQAQLFALLCGILEPDKPLPAASCAEPMIRPGKRV